jgi:uncharacterized protein Yka (UPF0111/DUF47 family)
MTARRNRRWFLPDAPDAIGLLRRQMAVTIEALEGLKAWAEGDAAAAEIVREAEPRGDAAKRDLLNALREDLFTLSRGIDWILDHARDLIEEAQAMDVSPTAGLAAMAALLLEATRQIDDAIAALGTDDEAATAAADAAIKTARRLEHTYYAETARLLEVDDTRKRISLRELYRRCDLLSHIVVDVAERVVYAVVKES